MINRKLKHFGFLFLLVLASGVLLTGCSIGKPKDSTKTSGTTISKPTPQPTKSPEESSSSRPYISLIPSADAHRLTLKLARIPSEITSFEYELIYFADFEGNKIERGVDSGGRAVDITGKTEYAKEFLLGSESCTTGKCKYRYDEGVSEGVLTLKFISSEGTDKYSTSYRLQNTTLAKEGLSTGDGAFMFKLTTKPVGVYLTMTTAGLPKIGEFTPQSSPYAIYPTTNYKGTVTFNSTLTEVSIYGYNGSAWQKLETTTTNGQLTAESSGNFLFILGK